MAIISNEKVLAIGHGRSLSSHRHLASRGEPGRPSRCVRLAIWCRTPCLRSPWFARSVLGRGVPTSLLCGKDLLETAALLPHAQLVGRSYEIGQSFLRFLFAQERIFHQRYHDLTFRRSTRWARARRALSPFTIEGMSVAISSRPGRRAVCEDGAQPPIAQQLLKIRDRAL